MTHQIVGLPERTAEEYSQEIFNIVKSGYVTFGISLGNELGLFKAIDELGKPVTAGEIADKATCKERYVREWALQMAMARVLEMDDTGAFFHLPEGGLEALKRVASFSMMLPRATLTHQDLLKAFPEAGPSGIPVAPALSLLQVLERFKGSQWAGMFTTDATSEMRGVISAMEAGVHVLDVGSSTGDCCIALGGQFPKSTYYGADVVESAILEAQKKALDRNVTNVHFEVQDAANFPLSWSDTFDVVFFFDVFHDIPQASKAAKEAYRILKKGGRCMVGENLLPSEPKEQERVPEAAILYTLSLYHCLPLSMNQEGSEALGNAAGPDKIKKMMVAAGFQLETMWMRSCPYSADRRQHMYIK